MQVARDPAALLLGREQRTQLLLRGKLGGELLEHGPSSGAGPPRRRTPAAQRRRHPRRRDRSRRTAPVPRPTITAPASQQPSSPPRQAISASQPTGNRAGRSRARSQRLPWSGRRCRPLARAAPSRRRRRRPPVPGSDDGRRRCRRHHGAGQGERLVYGVNRQEADDGKCHRADQIPHQRRDQEGKPWPNDRQGSHANPSTLRPHPPSGDMPSSDGRRPRGRDQYRSPPRRQPRQDAHGPACCDREPRSDRTRSRTLYYACERTR